MLAAARGVARDRPGIARATSGVAPRDRDNQLRCSGISSGSLPWKGRERPHEAGTGKETDGQRRYPWRNRRPLFLGAMLGATLRSVQKPIRYFRWLDLVFEGSRAHHAFSV